MGSFIQNIKTVIQMSKQLIFILNKRQRRQGGLLLLLFCISALLETLGVGVIVPFIMALMSPDALMENKIIGKMAGWLGITNAQELLIPVAVGIVLVYVIKDGITLAVNYYQIRFRNRIERDLSVIMLKSFLSRDYMYFVETNSSDIMWGVTGDVGNVAQVVDAFSTLFAETLTCFLLGVFLIYLEPFLAMGLILLAAITALSIVLAFKKKNAECGEQCREAFAKRHQYVYQPVCGYKEICVNQRKQYFIDQYKKQAEKACHFNSLYLFLCTVPGKLIETVFIAGLIIMVCLVMKFGDGGNIEGIASVMGAVALAAAKMLPAISNITAKINGLVYSRTFLENAYQNISFARRQEDEINKTENGGLTCGEDSEKARTFQHELIIKNLCWRYPEGDKDVLEDVSMKIEKGDAIGFVGESGAGKTTLADVILGLLHPQKGEVLMDGRDIFSMPRQWAKIISFVPQNVFLIDDTVRNNVAFGIYENEIDDDKVKKALQDAQIYDYIESLPCGMETIVGEKGVKLSGGQRQRIAIARALYDNPDILVLDEATSSLDNETESAVMQAIDTLKGTKTLIIIAHRLSTIRNCNKVYEIKNGRAILKEQADEAD